VVGVQASDRVRFTAVRPATSTDARALLDMMASFNVVEGIAFDPGVVEPALQRLLATPALGVVLVAVRGEDHAGYAVVTFSYDLEFAGRDAFVTELFVRSQYRRAGFARQLLAAIEARADADGVHALHLLALPDNEPALSLYESAGFSRSPRVMLTKRIGTSPRR
jgi:ribosomal protein S18 acetylase RimI-like enzyme